MTGKKEKISSDPTQDLVIFRSKEATKIKKPDKFTFESIDQEDKIKLLSDFKPYGGHYVLSIQLLNESLAPVSEVRIKFSFPPFFKLTRSYPPTIYIPESFEEGGMSKINLEFDELIREYAVPGEPHSGWVHISWVMFEQRKLVRSIS